MVGGCAVERERERIDVIAQTSSSIAAQFSSSRSAGAPGHDTRRRCW
jgi:hypothetical protein